MLGIVFETIVAADICQHLSEYQLFSDRQFGFRPSQSTSDFLLLFSQDWQNILNEGLNNLVMALDIAGAFGRVWYAGLVKKLHAKDIQGELLKLLEDYLQENIFQVLVNGWASMPLHIQVFIPQGSALGPIL